MQIMIYLIHSLCNSYFGIFIYTTGWGRIINLSPTAGLHAVPDISSYVASKTGLIGLTRVRI